MQEKMQQNFPKVPVFRKCHNGWFPLREKSVKGRAGFPVGYAGCISHLIPLQVSSRKTDKTIGAY